jgi:hypothetical protein
MGDLEQEAWADAVKELIHREEASNDDRLRELVRAKEPDGASFGGLGTRSPQDLLPKLQL